MSVINVPCFVSIAKTVVPLSAVSSFVLQRETIHRI